MAKDNRKNTHKNRTDREPLHVPIGELLSESEQDALKAHRLSLLRRGIPKERNVKHPKQSIQTQLQKV